MVTNLSINGKHVYWRYYQYLIDLSFNWSDFSLIFQIDMLPAMLIYAFIIKNAATQSKLNSSISQYILIQTRAKIFYVHSQMRVVVLFDTKILASNLKGVTYWRILLKNNFMKTWKRWHWLWYPLICSHSISTLSWFRLEKNHAPICSKL